MREVAYVAFQGIVDERMERLFACFKKDGWSIDVLLVHPVADWIVQSAVGRHILVKQKFVSNPIINELFLVPLFLFLKYLVEIPKLKCRVNLFYVHNYPDSFALPLLLLAKIFRIPTAYEIRDPWKEFIKTETSVSLQSRTRFRVYLMIVSIIELTTAALASGLVFATRSLRDVHTGNADRRPICLIRNYSDYRPTKEIQERGRSIREHLGLEDKFVVSYIGGGLQPYRGVDVLIESMKIVSRNEPKAKLLLVGGHGEALATLRQRIQEISVEDSCIITGWVPSQQLAYYYMASDAGVIPHRRTSATELAVPNKLFDYLVLGKPVIVSDLKEISELIEDGVSGLRVKADDTADLASAVLKLACNPSMVKQMSENALKLGQKYSFETVEQQFLVFISRLADAA